MTPTMKLGDVPVGVPFTLDGETWVKRPRFRVLVDPDTWVPVYDGIWNGEVRVDFSADDDDHEVDLIEFEGVD